MKLLKCKVCRGEVDIVDQDRSIGKKTKCRKCGYAYQPPVEKEPEIVIIRKRPTGE
jgi:hypothetical protein